MKGLIIFSLAWAILYTSCKSDVNPLPQKDIVENIKATSTPQDSQATNYTVPSSRNDERMSWQKPQEVIRQLGPLDNKVIADIGAGIGYFSFKLLPKAAKVISIDIDTDKIQILNGFKQTLSKEDQEKFDIRLATETHPNLREGEADIILIVNTIAYITPRTTYLRNMRKYLKEGGEVFIVDYKNKRMPSFVNPPDMDNRLYLNILEDQLEEAGYKDIVTDDTTLEYQYMVKAKR